jgi:hypothetical protein
MRLGVAIPAIDPAIGGDPAALREFAQAAEDIGYQDLAASDHVLGVNVALIGATATPWPICSTIHSRCSAVSPAAPGRSNSRRRC